MKVCKHLLFISFLFLLPVIGKADDISDQLNQLRQDDNLVEWIDLGLEKASTDRAESLKYLEKTEKALWRKPKTSEEKEAWLYLLINQGYYQLYYGDINNSINKYEEAYSYYQQEKIPINVEEYILKPLGNNYTRIGDFDRAVFIQKQSLNIAESEGNDTTAASIYNNLAITYLTKGNLDDAKNAVDLGLQLCKQTNNIYGLLYSTKAKILYEMQKYNQALSTAKTALKYLKQKRNTNYWQIGAYDIIAHIELHNGDYRSTEEHIKQALKLASAERKREYSTLYILKSRLFYEKKDYRNALIFVDEALSALDNQFNKSDLFPEVPNLYPEIKLQLALVLKGDILRATNHKEAALKAYVLAGNVSEMLRSGYTYRSSKRKQQEEAKVNAEKIIELAFELWTVDKNEQYAKLILETSEKTKARLLFDELKFNQERLASKNKAYADILNLERTIAYYEKQKRTEHTSKFDKKLDDLRFQLSSLKKKNNFQNYILDVNADQLVTQIPSHVMALVFFVGKQNTYIITASSKGITNIVKLRESAKLEKEVNDFVNHFFYQGADAMMNTPKTFFAESYKIYQSIFGALDLSKYEQLLIIKDGIYNYLSFDGLISSEHYSKKIKEWPFLIVRKKIRYQYSLFNISKTETNNPQHLFSGFFLSKTSGNSLPIPSVIYEYNVLKNMIDGRFYSNERVDSDMLKEKIENSNILHISSHAHVNDSTLEPVLELYNEKFYLFEIEPNHSVPKLVVLNACQTANGEYISGEGIESLARGFLAAGTKAVISSLWKVNDEAGAKLLILFYKNLLKSHNPADALRQAKLNWIHSHKTNHIMALPYYWDSAVYTGADIEITFNKAFNRTLYIMIAVIISVVVALLIFLFISHKSTKNKTLPRS